MNEFIINVIGNFGYIGILLLIMIENLFPPIPSEVILTLAGFLTIDSKMTILGVIIMSSIGSLMGAIILYLLGRLLSIDKLTKILSKFRIKIEDINKAENWFIEKGYITVLICRCIPLVRSLISIPAGTSKMPFKLFLFYTLIGSLIWNTTLILIGVYTGLNKDYILNYFNNITNIMLITVMLLTLYKIIKYYKNKIF